MRRFLSFAHRPNDPTWDYPYASRKRIEGLQAYFDQFKTPQTNGYWVFNHRKYIGRKGGMATDVFHNPKDRPPGPWPSVPPHLRQRAQEYFDREVAKTIAERGSITQGKLNSIRMVTARNARYFWTGKRTMAVLQYKRRKKNWLKYLAWKAEKERAALGITDEPRSKVLGIA